MEKHIGRRLSPEEVVHHKNGDTTDNSIDNLEIMPWDVHTTEHHSGRKRPDSEKRTLSVLAEYREEVKRLTLLNTELLEALRKQSLIIARAQTILADWIVPDSKISDHEALNALLGLLDGPEQREACHLMIAAIKKTEAQS